MDNFYTERKAPKPPPPAISVATGQAQCANCGGPINGPTIGGNYCSFDCMQSSQQSPPMPPWKPSVSG